MRLHVYSSRGHYDWAHPDEEVIITHIAIMDGDKLVKMVNIQTDYPIKTNNPDEAIDILEEWLKGIIYSTQEDKVKEMIQFIKEHRDEIEKENIRYELQKLKKEKAKIEKRIKELEQMLGGD